MGEDKFIKVETEGAKQEVGAEQVVPSTEDVEQQIAAKEDIERRASIQAEADAEAIAALRKIMGEEKSADATHGARHVGWSENATKIEAAEADKVERAAINGEYVFDGNKTQAENFVGMKAAEAGVEARNKAWAQQRIPE